MKKTFSLIFFLIVVFLIEWIGHQLTFTSVKDWYVTLQKPSWNPPSWVFGPVWTLLYIMIGVSGWQIFIKIKPCREKYIAFGIYSLQLLANILWSYFFFFLKNPGLAFIDILVLTSLIIINIIVFIRLDRKAGFLLIPYLMWTLYATYLNGIIWRLNS